MDKKLYSIKEVAQILSVSKRTLYDWVYTRKISYVKLKGKLIRIEPSEIDRMIEEGRQERRE